MPANDRKPARKEPVSTAFTTRPAPRSAPSAASWRIVRPAPSQAVVDWRLVAVSAALVVLLLGATVGRLALRKGRPSTGAAPAEASAAQPEPPPPPVPPDPAPQPKLAAPAVAMVPAKPVVPPVATPPPVTQAATRPATRGSKEVATSLPTPTSAPRAAASMAILRTAPKLLTIKRRSLLSDEDLRKQLLLAPEIREAQIPAAARNKVASARKDKRYTRDEMPEYAGLPLRMGVDCQLGKEAAENLQALSRKLRTAMAAAAQSNAADARPSGDALWMHMCTDKDGGPVWFQPEVVPVLTQMLMAENTSLRLLLVRLLACNPSPRAGAALAQRAVFDVSFDVRQAAVEMLNHRARDEYRDVLLTAFRHPWPAAADHAAEAMVALRDHEAVPALKELAHEPDPSAPVSRFDGRGPMVRELVRVNHLSNCTLCHAKSISSLDPVRGQIPSPSQPLPPPVQYYDSNQGTFVRADVTYLQQEFSVPQPVARAGLWPANQRYDYLVRTRPASVADFQALRARAVTNLGLDPALRPQETYPQREAVLFALRELDADKKAQAAKSATLVGFAFP